MQRPRFTASHAGPLLLVAAALGPGAGLVAGAGCAPDAVLEPLPAGGNGGGGTSTTTGAAGAGAAGASGGTGGAGGGGGGWVDLAPGEIGEIRTWGDDTFQRISTTAVAPNGDVVIAGTFNGTLELGNPPLVGEADGDIFVARLAPAGGTVWVRHFGSGGRDVPTDVAIDDDGNVLLVGTTESNALAFGNYTVTRDELDGTEPPDGELFVVKLNPQGIPQWAIDPAGPGERIAQTVAVQGNRIVVAGLFTGTTNLGSTVGTEMLEGPTERRGFVAAIDRDGVVHWSLALPAVAGTISPKHHFAVATFAPSGEVVASYSFSGRTVLGGNDMELALEADLAVLGLAPDTGTEQWYLRSAGNGEKAVEAMAVTNDKLFLGGRFVDYITLGASSAATADPDNTDDMEGFVARYDYPPLSYTPEKIVFLQADGMQAVTSLLATGDGVVAGLDFEQSLQIETEPYTAELVDTLVVAFDGALHLRRGIQIGGSGDEPRSALALLPTGDLVVGGSFFGELRIDGLVRADSVGGSTDMFLVTLGL